jgi:hypothetical protein
MGAAMSLKVPHVSHTGLPPAAGLLIINGSSWKEADCILTVRNNRCLHVFQLAGCC